jgi:hydroxypyruvate isomerase
MAGGRNGPQRFHLKFAPHFGMFKHAAGDDLLDQLKFAADSGFTAWEDNQLRSRPPALQERIAGALETLGIEMGAFVATASFRDATFAGGSAALQEAVLEDLRASIDVAGRVRARWLAVVPGRCEESLSGGDQEANCVVLLRRCCELLEPHGLEIVLVPWRRWSGDPACFLQTIDQADRICQRVGSPACRILFDLYHQQTTEGNLIPTIDRVWPRVAYFHCGDHPGRKEPGTGEINYRNVFLHLRAKGYCGIVGMEHGNSRPGAEGERAVIEAYVQADGD